MKLQEVTSYDLKSQTILNESWNMLTESQRMHVGRWERNVWPLMEELNTLLEAQLTADQIQSIFQNAEKVSIEGGKNMTALGKGAKVTAEVSGKIKAEIDKLLKQAADSEPVKNMDAQFDKLRSELATKLKTMKGGDKILAGVDKWKTFANENPAKSAFIIGAMTSVLAFASGGLMSGAAIGLFLRLANNTIKGDKLSTAVGKSIKTAALGAVAGALGDVFADMDIPEPEFEGGPAEVEVTASSDEIASSGGEETASAIAEMTEEQFKEAYAREILERQAEKFNMPVTDAMVQKIADNVEITGNYPDDYNAGFEGTFVRGTTYLTPEEAQEYSRIVQSNGGGMEGAFSKEANEFIKDAGGAGPNVVPDTPDDDLDAAIGGDAEPETDSLAPGEGFTSESGATYSKEEMQNVIKQAAERGEIPDPEELVRGKDIDAGYYTDDIQAIRDEFRELGIDNMKVPDEDALRAIGLDPEDVDIAEPRAGASDADLEKAMDQGNAKVDPETDTNTVKHFGKEYTRDELLAAKQDGSIKRSIANKLLRKLEIQAAAESIEDQLWDNFALYEASLQEGPLGSAAKGFAKSVGGVVGAGAKAAASGAVSAVKKGASAVGKELGQKITARKLNKMWKDAGSPTNTGEIANILSQAGLSDEDIGVVGKENNVELKAPTQTQSPDDTQQSQDGQKPQNTQQTAQQSQIDIKSLADQIKKAGVADVVKQQLTTKKQPTPKQKPRVKFRSDGTKV